MSPRKPAVLRDRGGQNLREYLIATAAGLIGRRGTADLSVRAIAREAQVADGVLYNYFEDKEDLLAHALLAHVADVMGTAPQLVPPAGSGTVAGNLAQFIDRGLEVLGRVTPAFAGLLSQPKVLTRFHAMVGGDAAFGAGGEDPADDSPADDSPADDSPADDSPADDSPAADSPAADSPGHGSAGHGSPGGDSGAEGGDGRQGLPDLLTAYLRAEQRLGRIDAGADIDATSKLIVGAIHGLVLPRIVFTPPGTLATAPGQLVTAPAGLSRRLAETILRGIAPASAPR
jgi:AcrR family transcriptional regulator